MSPLPRSWTIDDVEALLASPDADIADLARQLGRTPAAIRTMRKTLVQDGLLPRRPSRHSAAGTGHATPWTPEELALADDATLTHHQIAARTGRTPGAVRAIRKIRGFPGHVGLARKWTEDEESILIAHADQPVEEIAAMLGRTAKAVRTRRSILIGGGHITGRWQLLGSTDKATRDRAIIAAIDAGSSVAEVAAAFGLSRTRIKDVVRMRRLIETPHEQ